MSKECMNQKVYQAERVKMFLAFFVAVHLSSLSEAFLLP